MNICKQDCQLVVSTVMPVVQGELPLISKCLFNLSYFSVPLQWANNYSFEL